MGEWFLEEIEHDLSAVQSFVLINFNLFWTLLTKSTSPVQMWGGLGHLTDGNTVSYNTHTLIQSFIFNMKGNEKNFLTSSSLGDALSNKKWQIT